MNNMEKPTFDEVIIKQCLKGIYDALNEIEFLKYKLETVPQIFRLITGDCIDNDAEAETAEQMASIMHYTEYLVKELGEQIEKAQKDYFRIQEQRNGTKA